MFNVTIQFTYNCMYFFTVFAVQHIVLAKYVKENSKIVNFMVIGFRSDRIQVVYM